jgi:hypothetical protein
MKRTGIVVLLAASALAAWALASPQVGSIDYVEGSVSIGRSGKTIAAPNIGDAVLSGDLIKTSSDGLLVVAMGKTSGMSGTVTVRARSAIYMNLAMVKEQPQTKIELITGSIGSKVAKLAGAGGTMSVASSSAVMAVRGTEFEIYVSINMNDDDPDGGGQAVLVTCTEGKVAISDGGKEFEAPAGKVVEKRPGKALRYVPVAVSSIKEYGRRWVTDEIAAFKSDAIRALASYAKRYENLSAKFAAAYAKFKASPIPKKWADEDKKGAAVRSLDPATLREKKDMAGILLEMRKILFMFERIYYRADEISDAIKGTPLEKKEIRKGLTAGEFLRKVEADRAELEDEVARYRYIVALYAARSPEGDVFAPEDDFFSTPDGF